MRAILFSILCCAVLSGCATTQQPQQREPLQTSKVYDAPKTAVWPLVVAEVSQQYPVKVIEKESGLIATEFVAMPAGFNNGSMARWVVPPGGFLATWNGLRMNMNVLVTEVEPGKTRVNIRTHYEAFENNVQKTWIVCDSNGSVENGIFTRVESSVPKTASR